MANVILPPSWALPEYRVTDESVYLNRRQFMKGAGAGLITGALGLTGCAAPKAARQQTQAVEARALAVASQVADESELGPLEFGIEKALTKFRPGATDPAFAAAPDGRVLTAHETAASFNNFYEFTTKKKDVWRRVGDFTTTPWSIEVAGLVHEPAVFDLNDLMTRFPAQERIYRHRCVEAWAMVVPWTGFPLRALLDLVKPMGSAKFVRFVTAQRPEQMPGLKNQSWYPWPYFEALRIDEATNPLTFLATGLYGRPLPRQNGAPARLVVPWKYGYKSIKSIVRIELVEEQPTTFWSSLVPDEYDFWSNVDPKVPHPRWSQATERDIQTGEKHPTLAFNGYADQVAGMY